ncbi:MAG: hypothetical protein RIB86_16685 [Imperialibacter sp.]
MKLPQYSLSSDSRLTTFQFTSEGPQGQIAKLVQFTPTNLKGVYNLAFGDKDMNSGEIDDLAISNNNDSERVLGTVVATIYVFTENRPDVWVYATGSTLARTRLYRIGITKYLADAEGDFEIFGRIDNNWEPFKKGIDYIGFILRRKKTLIS